MVTSACAAPLIVDFGGFVALMPRNEPPFTCVHSHAGAQKSSECFSAIQTGNGAGNGPQAAETLRASRAVRARTLMLNLTGWHGHHFPCSQSFCSEQNFIVLFVFLVVLLLHCGVVRE